MEFLNLMGKKIGFIVINTTMIVLRALAWVVSHPLEIGAKIWATGYVALVAVGMLLVIGGAVWVIWVIVSLA